MKQPSWRRAGAVLGGVALTAAILTACGQFAPEVLPAGQATAPRELGPVTAAAFAGNRPASVVAKYQSRQQLTQLQAAGMEITYVDQAAKKVYGEVSKAAFADVQRVAPGVQLVQAPGRTKRGTGRSAEAGYRTYAQIKTDLAALAKRYPQLARLDDVGDSWEKRQGKSDRDLLALRIGTGDAGAKPGVLFLGNHHARELVTPEIVMNIATMLLEGYGKDPEVTYWVDSRDIVLVPMVNPDGHEVALGGYDWRKNTDLAVGGGTDFEGAPEGPGVDLNRNYGYKWGGEGASTRASHPTFRGPAAFSEPETQAMKALIDSRKWTFLMTYHSFSNLVLWPWGHTDQAPPDKRLATIGKQLGKLSGYKPQQSVDLYPTSGDTTDYAFGTQGTLAYTTEIGSYGDGFDPPFSEMGRFWKENVAGARLLLQLAENPTHIDGPALAKASLTKAGTLTVAASGATAAEAFVGRLGADGTGTPIALKGGAGETKLAAKATGVVLVHAKDAQGHWGPPTALFAK